MGGMKHKGEKPLLVNHSVRRRGTIPFSWFFFFEFWACIDLFCTYVWVHMCHVTHEVEDTLRGGSFPSTMWVRGLRLRLSGSANTSTCRDSQWPVTGDYMKMFGNRRALVLGLDLLRPCLLLETGCCLYLSLCYLGAWKTILENLKSSEGQRV